MENIISCIYKITSPNSKIYVGQTVNFKNRCRKYKYNTFKGQIKLWNDCQKYDWNPTDFIEIIEECLKDSLDEREQYWIKFYDSFENGLNCDLGGIGRKGYKPSEETKEKIRQSNLGKKHTQETRDKMGKDRIGSKLSKEHIEKIKQSKKENPFVMSQEQKDQISKNNLGNTKRLGKIHSEESKKKISESKKGSIITSYDKKILNTTTGEIYNSQREAAEKLQTRINNILRVCNGDRKSCKGMILEYYTEKLENE